MQTETFAAAEVARTIRSDATVSSRLLLFVWQRILRMASDLFRCRAQHTALQLEEEDAVIVVVDDEEEEP